MSLVISTLCSNNGKDQGHVEGEIIYLLTYNFFVIFLVNWENRARSQFLVLEKVFWEWWKTIRNNQIYISLISTSFLKKVFCGTNWLLMLKMWIVVWRCCWDVASYCAYELILMNTTLIDKYRFTDDVVYLSIPNKKLVVFYHFYWLSSPINMKGGRQCPNTVWL